MAIVDLQRSDLADTKPNMRGTYHQIRSSGPSQYHLRDNPRRREDTPQKCSSFQNADRHDHRPSLDVLPAVVKSLVGDEQETASICRSQNVLRIHA